MFIHYWFFLQSSFGVSASPNAAAKSGTSSDCTTDWIGVRFSLKFHYHLKSSNYLNNDFQCLNAFTCGIFLICRSKEEIQMQMLLPEPFLLSIVSAVENFFLQETLLGQQQSHQLLLSVVRTYYIMIWSRETQSFYVQFLHFKHDFSFCFKCIQRLTFHLSSQ